MKNPPLPTLDEARAIVAQSCHALPPQRAEPAPGRTLRETIPAPEDVPAFDRSAWDGFAFRSADTPGTLPIAAEIPAGAPPGATVAHGECVRIFTGAQIPSGADAVAMQEDCARDGAVVKIPATAAGNGIRRRAEDCRAGSLLIPRGTALGAIEVSLLAQCGITRPLLAPRPRVLHIVTGDELVPPAATPGPGQIRDSNSALVAALAAQTGSELIAQRRAGDTAESLAGAICESGDFGWDALLISGGASVGDYDFGARVLRQLGFSIHFDKVNLRPGKPLIFATRGRQLAFVIPGNPLSHFVCWHAVIRSALEILATGETTLPACEALLTAALPGNPRETWWPARLRYATGSVSAEPARWQSSGDLTALAGVDALIRVPTTGLEKGAVAAVVRVR